MRRKTEKAARKRREWHSPIVEKGTVAAGRVNPAPGTALSLVLPNSWAHRRRRLGVDAAVSRDGYTPVMTGMPGLILI